MENFNSFEINAENVIGGTAISTPTICVPSVTVNATPVITGVKATVGSTLAKVGGLLSTVQTTASSISANVSASVNVGVTAGTSNGCGC